MYNSKIQVKYNKNTAKHKKKTLLNVMGDSFKN